QGVEDDRQRCLEHGTQHVSEIGLAPAEAVLALEGWETAAAEAELAAPETLAALPRLLAAQGLKDDRQGRLEHGTPPVTELALAAAKAVLPLEGREAATAEAKLAAPETLATLPDLLTAAQGLEDHREGRLQHWPQQMADIGLSTVGLLRQHRRDAEASHCLRLTPERSEDDR